jgi:hypothetical protein
MRLFMACAMTLAFAGCGVELLTTAATQSELQAQQLSAIRGQVQNTASTSGRINIERAIAAYTAEKGAFPPSLEALVPHWLPSLPQKPDGTPYEYDPATGKLLDSPAVPGGPTPADLQLMEQIKTAINQYGMATGFYPPTLDALVPQYLPAAPRTNAGEPFIYDNQTGYLAHPAQGRTTASPAPGPTSAAPPASGAGPMGEVMTGVGVQQELNRMGSSGADAAGGYARRSVRGTAATHDQQTGQTMDDLGL